VNNRAKQETAAWPYTWAEDVPAYHDRGSISGTITLSDGRPASGAAIFLGENRSNKTTLDQGSLYNYRTYADDKGNFMMPNVREGLYALHAWPNGGPIGDITTVFVQNDVKISTKSGNHLGTMKWATQGRKLVWQVGTIDRKASEFKYSGPPHEHARATTKCSADTTFTIGKNTEKDWCFAQGDPGTWTIQFDMSSLPTSPSPAAVLSLSLAGFSSVLSSSILMNNSPIGSLSQRELKPDSSLPRSGTVAGEWKYVEFNVQAGRLRQGLNTLDFKISNNTQWRGYMFDSILLEWK
jgi:rhamnogalacturonan endolyase